VAEQANESTAVTPNRDLHTGTRSKESKWLNHHYCPKFGQDISYFEGSGGAPLSVLAAFLMA
jgi:hypothetical protein